MNTQTWEEEVFAQLNDAKKASLQLALASSQQKNEALRQMAEMLWQNKDYILTENEKDITKALKTLEQVKIDRLRLTEDRILSMVEGLNQIALLDDPIGEICERVQRPNTLVIEKVRVPMGVIAIIYESRPNVTADAAGLALKTGNAVVLRGGKEAFCSNQAIVKSLQAGLKRAGLNPNCLQFISSTNRETVDYLIRARGLVDLAIPRGGASLINHVIETALVPVIETGVGNCHVYVDRSANYEMATSIVVNAKTQRPSVCNAAETLLVHRDLAMDWLPECVSQLQKQGVEIRACKNSYPILLDSCKNEAGIIPAEASDFSTEFLNLTLAVKLVDSVDDAIAHISEYGTKHSEAIITEDKKNADRFLASVDASVVYHNASTRFTDGFEFGYGAEIGISTQKLHARGPMGLSELTSYKYVVHGNGQIRV